MVGRRDVELWSEGTRIAAEIFTPAGEAPAGGWPAILLCHGWGGLKSHLARYAGKFAAAGYLCMTFDYRGWGESDGRIIAPRSAPRLLEAEARTMEVIVLRETVDPVDLTWDVRNCLAYLWSEPGVDRRRIGLWGTSYGGGHVVFVSGQDDRVKAVVAQIGGFGFPPEYRDWAREQAADKVRGRIDPVVPQHGLNGVPGLKGTPDVGRQEQHSPLRLAAQVRVPTLVIDAEFEELNNRLEHGWAAYMAIRQNAPAQYVTYPCKHYDVYDAHFDDSTDRALAWFGQYL